MTETPSGDSADGAGGGGCITFVMAVVVLWAFLFGVTYGGKHYSLSLSCSEGVLIR